MRPEELERRLQERLDALGPAPRAELLNVLMLPDFDRADAIGSYWFEVRAVPLVHDERPVGAEGFLAKRPS